MQLGLPGSRRWVALVALAAALLEACGSSEAAATPDARAEDDAADAASIPARGSSRQADSSAPDNSGASAAGEDSGVKSGAQGAGGCATFDSSFAALQTLVFERHGCTASACHGDAKVGGLDLRAQSAWESLVDAPSSNSSSARVQPGTAVDSFLFQKLAAATNPGSVDIKGSPMPVGAVPLSANELEAVQLWIQKGAPKTGVVADLVTGVDVGSLLDACLPTPEPVKTKPLEPPAEDEGIQLLLPSYVLKGSSEVEHCTPFAFDFTNRVPARFKDEARNVIYTNGSRVRQDPQSHHMVVWNPNKDLASVSPTDPDWTCHGGGRAGTQCDATKGSADCSGGVCAGKSVPGSLCSFDTQSIGAGGLPDLNTLAAAFELLASGGIPGQVANTQSPQQYTPPLDGVYTEIPLHGILWFDSHAFNLTEQDTVLEARVNYYYAKALKQEMRLVNIIDNNGIADGQAPFTRQTYCAKTVVPQHYSIATMTGHTHRHGEHFWVTNAAGDQIYENFVYNDPVYKHYDPWLAFEAADDASRTLQYCATYNNGLQKDGSPDPELVTRASRMPAPGKCTPVACTAGKVMSACTTDSDCDTMTGAHDGDCDACPITAGQTTENEMFVMMPWYVMPPKN